MEKTLINYNEISYVSLSKEQIDDLLLIQDEAFSFMEDKSLLRRNTKETLESCFLKPSVVLGVIYQNELIAFGILFYPNDESENLGKEIDFVKNRLCANIKLIIVKQRFRGNKLQLHLLKKLEEIARNNGTEFLCATVSPKNIYSIGNFKLADYKEIKTVIKYNGLTRVLLLKEI